jgi:ubiquinone/menaquinone biosynthesis C-methylase UbiE
MNKTIHRESSSTKKIFDDRTLAKDYATLLSVLKKGLHVLDVGCGTGAISKGIAECVGAFGSVTGIDNTETFITSGKETYKDIANLQLIHADLFAFESETKFDLIVAARTFQWLNNPKEALKRLRAFLKPGGLISILDYNHEGLEWDPDPPESMRIFYSAFLKWRADAGMDNRISEVLADYFSALNFHSIEVHNADEIYTKGEDNFLQRVGIWSKVAELKQIVEDGYIDEGARLKAIQEYNEWVAKDAKRMIMKLNEVRGKI